MTAETKTSLARVCAAMVPKEADHFELFDKTLWWSCGDWPLLAIEIPSGDWKILGELGHITEEQADLVIEHIKPFLDKRYRDYTDSILEYRFDFTWQKGLKSLTDSMEVYAVNPYGEEKPLLKDNEDLAYRYHSEGQNKYGHLVLQWQRAQSRTGRWMLIYEPIQ